MVTDVKVPNAVFEVNLLLALSSAADIASLLAIPIFSIIFSVVL